MRILLDIDGVMVPAKSWEKPEILEDGFPKFSEKAVRALNIILSQKDTIVITSTHKARYSIEKWKEIFRARGVFVNNVIILSGSEVNGTRKDEILNWLSQNAISECYIIIDDDKSLNGLPSTLKENLIQPYSHIGLTEDLLYSNSKITFSKVG